MLGENAAVEILGIVLDKAIELPPASRLREIYLTILHRLFHVVPRVFYQNRGGEQRERRDKIMDVLEAILDMSAEHPDMDRAAVLRTNVILAEPYFEAVDDPLEFPAPA